MAAPETHQENLYIGGLPYVIKKASDYIAASQTDDAFIADVASYKIRIVSLLLFCDAATTVTINTVDAAADTALTPIFALAAKTPLLLPMNPKGWFESVNAGEGISITTGAGGNTSIIAHYIEI